MRDSICQQIKEHQFKKRKKQRNVHRPLAFLSLHCGTVHATGGERKGGSRRRRCGMWVPLFYCIPPRDPDLDRPAMATRMPSQGTANDPIVIDAAMADQTVPACLTSHEVASTALGQGPRATPTASRRAAFASATTRTAAASPRPSTPPRPGRPLDPYLEPCGALRLPLVPFFPYVPTYGAGFHYHKITEQRSFTNTKAKKNETV
jgi:hypothetical protein